MANINEHIKNTLYDILWQKETTPTTKQVTIDETPLTKVKEKWTLGIFIDEKLSFTLHGELTTKKCRSAYNKLTLYPDLAPNVALQLYKAYIRSRLEHGCII